MRHSSSPRRPCGFSEDLLIATALGELPHRENDSVAAHLARCRACEALVEQYRHLRTHLPALSTVAGEDLGLAAARRRLEERLVLVARPRLHVTTWRSPIGELRLGSTDKGVALVEFVGPDKGRAAPRWRDDFAVDRGGAELAAMVATLEAYFGGAKDTLGWVVDDVLMRSDFQRAVLHATADVPYGAVVTYQGIAAAIGQPRAVRAVAQALRHNPIPICIPCHRVIGSDGTLTGYAGNRVDLKRRILQVEGIPVVDTRKGLAIATAQMYVGWRRDRCFCRPRCRTLKDQPAGDRAFITSRTRAEAMGYEPCDVCRPDLQVADDG